MLGVSVARVPPLIGQYLDRQGLRIRHDPSGGAIDVRLTIDVCDLVFDVLYLKHLPAMTMLIGWMQF